MPPIIACATSNYARFGAAVAIERVRDTGLEYVELPIRTAGFRSRAGDVPLLTDASSSQDVRTVQTLLADHGVKLASINALSGNPLRPDVRETLVRKLELAAALDVSLVIIEAGEATSEERPALLAYMREFGDRAASLGLTLCCETHRGVCVNHREMLEFMRELSHPNVRLNVDTANLLYYNEHVSVEVALAKVCHLTRGVHLKDCQGQYGQWYFPTLGQGGAVDFLRVYQIMRDVRFRGPLTIEIGGIEGEGELTLEAYHTRVVESVKYLRHLGYFDRLPDDPRVASPA